MTLTFPTGTIKTFRPGTTTPYGIPWTQVSRWEPYFSDSAFAHDADPRLLAAMAVVESNANHYVTGKMYGSDPEVVRGSDSFGDGPATGIMQVKLKLWGRLVECNPLDPGCNIYLGAKLMRQFINETGSWQNAIRQKYHPGTSAAGITPQMYVDTVQSLMDEMQGGTMPEWKPVIYDIKNNADAGRFGLTPQERDKLLKNRIASRDGKAINAIGLHVQWGYTTGSLDWWVNGPNVQASATVMVQQDGSVLKVIPEEHGPWTQGDVKNPDARARKLFDRFGWNPNVYSLTIEAEDGQTEKINAAQEQAIAWLIRDWQKRYPQLAGADWEDRILGHYEINSVDRSRCGRYRDAMVASLRGGTTPAPEPTPEPEWEGLEAWCPPEYLKAAFPLADPAGSVTKRLIAWMMIAEQLPIFDRKIVVDEATNKNIWVFDKVTLLNHGSTVWVEGEDVE